MSLNATKKRMLKIKILPQEFLKTEAELIIVSLFKDIIPLKDDAGCIDWLLNGQISNLIKGKRILGNLKEITLLSSLNKLPSEKILLVGFGKASNLTSPKILYIFSNIIGILDKIRIKDFGTCVCIKGISDSEYLRIARCMIGGILKGFSFITPSDSDYTVKIAEGDERRFLILNKVIRSLVGNFKEKQRITLEA